MKDGESALAWFRSRRSRRRFADRPIERAVIERLLEAATTAPSSTNRQPWRFAVVTAADMRARIVAAIQSRTERMRAVIERGHHAEDFGRYGDFFFEPLASAAAIVVPQQREHANLIAEFIASGGGDPRAFRTTSNMQAERCATSAAVMLLLLQAHAEGLGACWMAGPMVAQDEIEALLDIRPPWQMLGAVALGYPDGPGPAGPGRKPLDRVVMWFEDNLAR